MSTDPNQLKPAYLATVPKVQDDGTIRYVEVDNIDVHGDFLMDQRYLFPVNDKDGDGSVTYVRCVIPAGTPFDLGYQAIRDMLEGLGMVPQEVADALNLPEIMA